MTNEEIIKGLQATNEHIGKHFNEGGAWMAEFIDNAIKALEQQPKRGHWEDCSNGWMCSNCYRDVTYESDFCPNCGCRMDADMRESEEVNADEDSD